MLQPIKHGGALLAEIDQAEATHPRLWWLGHCGFVVKYFDIIFYLDPLLSDSPARRAASPLRPEEVRHADMVLCSHAHGGHMDPETLPALLAASTRAKVVLPKSSAEHARSIGISYQRMTTTDGGLRVEYFKQGAYARVYAVPSAHPELDYTPLGGYPYLGYLVRCGECTFYHAGDSVPYEGLADRLRPYNVSVAMLPIGGPSEVNFTIEEASALAADIGARWLVPMHYGTLGEDNRNIERFVEHMLFHRPEQRFKVFACGEGWQVPPPGAE
ncbi:MAG: MBL fold metallo-hydrolase [Bryobacterales bacterium]|nr:MBL fold metallo-hydrolase [Bryobacterales bacterium]